MFAQNSITRWVARVLRFMASLRASLKRTVAAEWNTTFTSARIRALSLSLSPKLGSVRSPGTGTTFFSRSTFSTLILLKTCQKAQLDKTVISAVVVLCHSHSDLKYSNMKTHLISWKPSKSIWIGIIRYSRWTVT